MIGKKRGGDRMLSRNKVNSEIHNVMELRLTHPTRYLIGYEDGLRWIKARMKEDNDKNRSELERIRHKLRTEIIRLHKHVELQQERAKLKSQKTYIEGEIKILHNFAMLAGKLE